jgi:hypothetical protein
LCSKAIGILSCPESRSKYNERLRKWKELKKRKSEMDSSRKLMRQRLEERESAALRETFNHSASQDHSSFPQRQNPPKNHNNPQIIANSTVRDQLLDFLAPFGDLDRFIQIAPGQFQFSPQSFLAFKSVKDSFTCSFEIKEPSPLQRFHENPSEFDLELHEFLLFLTER